MAGIAAFEGYLWPVMMLAAAGLAVFAINRKSYRTHPFFIAYLLAALVQNLVLALSYRVWGFSSSASFRIAWTTQSFVVTLRALAVVEVFRIVLAKYAGIWALGWRIFVAAATGVLIYSWAVSAGRWELAAVNADRSLELAIAVAILGLFVFAHYYRIPVDQTSSLLATGFFIYSCSRALNDTVLDRWLTAYTAIWNLLTTVAYLTSLLLWTWALRQTQERPAAGPELLPESDYRVLSPAINARLKALNEQLGHFWHAEGEKT